MASAADSPGVNISLLEALEYVLAELVGEGGDETTAQEVEGWIMKMEGHASREGESTEPSSPSPRSSEPLLNLTTTMCPLCPQAWWSHPGCSTGTVQIRGARTLQIAKISMSSSPGVCSRGTYHSRPVRKSSGPTPAKPAPLKKSTSGARNQ